MKSKYRNLCPLRICIHHYDFGFGVYSYVHEGAVTGGEVADQVFKGEIIKLLNVLNAGQMKMEYRKIRCNGG